MERVSEMVDPEYDEVIVPIVTARLAAARRVLDVGCGEGRVARALGASGATVIGVDGATEMLAAARASAHGVGPGYVRADVTRLPISDGAVDGAVAVLVMEHLVAMEEAVAEIARTLAPGGRIVLVVNHPMAVAPGGSWVHDHMVEPPDHHFRLGRYLERRRGPVEVSAGVAFDFSHRTLGDYVEVLTDNALFLESLDEPAPAESLESVPGSMLIPRLAVLTGRKR